MGQGKERGERPEERKVGLLKKKAACHWQKGNLTVSWEGGLLYCHSESLTQIIKEKKKKGEIGQKS